MIHKIFLSLSLIALSSIGMERQALLPWVQQAQEITVASSLQKTMGRFSITDTTTVADVKKSVRDSEGIAVEHQTLHPLIKSWWTLKLFEKASKAPLPDATNIKQAMSDHNTARFLMLLWLKKPAEAQK